MSISTYSELKSSIADFLNRDDLTSVIPTFIRLAEADVAKKLRHWLQEKKVRAPFDEGFEFLPEDWLQTISLRNADGTEIRQVGVTEMAQLKRLPSTGKPQFYRVEARRIEVFPSPDVSHDVDLLYYARIPALSDAAPTNWLLTNHPDILLYGSLVQAATYLGDNAGTGTWATLYTSSVDALQSDSTTARHSGPLRMRIR